MSRTAGALGRGGNLSFALQRRGARPRTACYQMC